MYSIFQRALTFTSGMGLVNDDENGNSTLEERSRHQIPQVSSSERHPDRSPAASVRADQAEHQVKPASAKMPCNTCASLDLSVEKFVIDSGRTTRFRPSSESLRLTNERFHLGTMAVIQERARSCPLFSLIVYNIGTETCEELNVFDAVCNLTWEMDGRMSLDPRDALKRKRTRRLKVTWSDPKLKAFDSYLVLTARSKYDISDLDYPKQLNSETQYLGRRFGAMESKKNLIREFLNLCKHEHDAHCRDPIGIEGDFSSTLSEPYFGVIDIENESLVPLPHNNEGRRLEFADYAAISYVWGDSLSRVHRTKIGNIQDRRKSGGLASTIQKLPRSLRQSIRLVHDLGIKHVWIDAICIVQDSSHSWNLNARAMHLIYGNSTLTICAADGDSETGLLALERDQRTDQQVARYRRGVNLILHQSPEVSIESSKWNQRGWTFQERLLSRRCLIFTGGQVYFQCRSTSMSEDIFADRRGQGWSLDLAHAPLQKLSGLKQRSVWFYAHCVSLYTLRKLYEPLDILAAFSGMCKLMENIMQAPFAFGLPTSHFDFALLWEPVDLSELLDYSSASHEPKYKDLKFPSWSWCGWKIAGTRYQPQMIDGCLDDVHAWLLNHTWIDWHIRDGHGSLRRLWDKQHMPTDQSADLKWRGYSCPQPQSGGPMQVQESLQYGEDDRSSHSVEPDDSVSNQFQERGQNHHNREDFHQGRIDEIHFVEENNNDYVHIRRRSEQIAYDFYGRPVKSWRDVDRSEFALTLPEDPYHVTTAAGNLRDFPDQPFLQFFTWRTRLHLVRSTEPEFDEDYVGKTRARCHITDQRGDKCGSIIVDKRWLEKNEHDEQTEFEFIAISAAKSFTKEEFSVWTYYLPKDRVDSEWDLFYVLLVEEYPKEGIYRRVALGKGFKAAFTLSDDEWKEIILG